MRERGVRLRLGDRERRYARGARLRAAAERPPPPGRGVEYVEQITEVRVLDPYRLNDGDRSRPVLLPRPSKLLGRHLGIASELLLPPLGLALTLLEGCPPNERPSLARYHAAAEPTLPSLASGEGLLLRPAGSIH